MTDLLKLIINNHEGLLIAYKKRFDLLYSKFDDTEKCTVDSLNIKETIKLIVGQIKEHSSTVITDKKSINKYLKEIAPAYTESLSPDLEKLLKPLLKNSTVAYTSEENHDQAWSIFFNDEYMRSLAICFITNLSKF